MNKKAVVLFMVLATFLIVIILANVVMNLMYSQALFSEHHIDRLRAYYAAMAGLNYAFEGLRKGNWSTGNSFNLNDVVANSGIPYTVTISIGAPDVNGQQVNVTTTYNTGP